MAYTGPRYAAFLKKHGRSESDQNLIPKKHSAPRKFDPHYAAPVLQFDFTRDDGKPGAGLEEISDHPIAPQPRTPIAPSVSSNNVNIKKRSATPDHSLAADLHRAESPVKFLRTGYGKNIPAADAEQRFVREKLADVSLISLPSNHQADDPSSISGGRHAGQTSSPRKGSPLKDEKSASPSRGHLDNTVLTVRDKLTLPTESQRFDQGTRSARPGHVLSSGLMSPTEEDDDVEYELPVNTYLVSQPESRPITHDQLTAEVKAIYAGLVIIEAKCINVVSAQSTAFAQGREIPQLDAAHWQAMIALHRTLLHEHHDFLLASQHPSASQPLRNLALKYSMPARMWKHGIHNFLELLRRRLPHSLEFMLSFIYMAYQMIALLYETVPSFEETWIECLGDLSRYRMAIEDEDQSDRDTWTGVARYWYSKAADKTPTVGRLYHHLAILARSQALQQLSLYCRSLSAIHVFQSARESIMTLFDPILVRSTSAGSRPLSVESWFIRCHALIFTQSPVEAVNNAIATFLTQLVDHMTRMEGRWRLQGVYIAITNVASLLVYGSPASTLRELFMRKTGIANMAVPAGAADTSQPALTVSKGLCAWKLIFPTFDLALKHVNRDDTLPHIHVMLVFIWRLALLPNASDWLKYDVPWDSVSKHLNTLCVGDLPYNRIEGKYFPIGANGNGQQLPEDFLMRGLVWSQDYFPTTWFDYSLGEDERMVELPMMKTWRAERVLWLGVRITQHKPYLQYDNNSKQFFLPGHYDHVQYDSKTSYAFHERFNTFAEKVGSHPKVKNSFDGLV